MRLLIVLFFGLCSWSAFSQITEKFEATPLTEVLGVLESNYGLKLSYDPKLIKNITVTADLKNESIHSTLEQLFKNTQLSYTKVRSKYYSIHQSKVNWNMAGIVKDVDGIPIPFAKIRVLFTRQGTHANEAGVYSFNYKSDSPPTIEITAFGYLKMYRTAEQLQNSPNVSMTANVIEYPDIVVEYLTEGIFTEDDVSSLSIRPSELGSVPGTTEPDVFQLVQTVPGINSASSTVNEIQIRGGTADQNHLLWDGIPVYHPGHFNGMISSVNPNIVHKANLHRGIYDPYYGGKASGLIDLHSIDKIPSRLKATAGINMLQADVYLLTPLSEKIAVLVSARRSYMDIWTSPTYKKYAERVYQETEILNSGSYSEDPEFSGATVNALEVSNDFVYSDLNGKVIYKPNEDDLLTVSSIFTNNTLNYSTVLTEDNEAVSNELNSVNFGLSAHYIHRWNGKWETDIQSSYAQYNYSYFYSLKVEEEDTTLALENVEKSNAVRHFDIKLKNTYSINDNHSLDFGYQLNSSAVGYSFESIEEGDSAQTIGNTDGIVNSLHINHIWKKKKWLSKIGVRGSYLTIHESLYAEPRVYLQYKVATPFYIKTSFGIQNQFISQIDQLDDAQLGLSNRVWVMTDTSEIPVVQSLLADIGFIFQHNGWYIEAEAYWKQLSNIVSFSDNPNLSSGLVRGEATATGIDLLIKKRWKNYRSWISYSLSRVGYSFDDFFSSEFNAPFNQPHTFKWGNTLKWRNFEFASAFKIASGKAYTPLEDVILDPDPDPDPEAEGEELYEMVLGIPYSRRLPIFHQLDLTMFYNLPNNPDKNWNLKIGVSCFNIYNKVNILSRSYELEFNEEDPLNPFVENYAIDKYYLGITPNALIRIEFK